MLYDTNSLQNTECRIRFVYELFALTFEVLLDMKDSTNIGLTAKKIQRHLASH